MGFDFAAFRKPVSAVLKCSLSGYCFMS